MYSSMIHAHKDTYTCLLEIFLQMQTNLESYQFMRATISCCYACIFLQYTFHPDKGTCWSLNTYLSPENGFILILSWVVGWVSLSTTNLCFMQEKKWQTSSCPSPGCMLLGCMHFGEGEFKQRFFFDFRGINVKQECLKIKLRDKKQQHEKIFKTGLK